MEENDLIFAVKALDSVEVTGTYHQLCSYCGGYFEGEGSFIGEGAAMQIRDGEKVTDVCPRCLIKAFDRLLKIER